jgi:ribosomal protein S18 acetylase RimI-like enzyme
MESHPCQVVRLASSDAPLAQRILEAAFEDYPLMKYAAEDRKRRRRGVRALYGSILRACMRWGEVYGTTDGAGAACWLPPGQSFPSLFRQVRAGMLGVPIAFGWSGMRRLLPYDAVGQKLHHAHGVVPHWYLWAIGVEPSRQGQGVAGRLMAPILSRADRDGHACYLETQVEGNVRIYERQGFTMVERCDLPGRTIPVWGMLRRARPNSVA